MFFVTGTKIISCASQQNFYFSYNYCSAVGAKHIRTPVFQKLRKCTKSCIRKPKCELMHQKLSISVGWLDRSQILQRSKQHMSNYLLHMMQKESKYIIQQNYVNLYSIA